MRFILFLFVFFFGPFAFAAPSNTAYVEGEVIVRYRSPLSVSAKTQHAKKTGLQQIRALSFSQPNAPILMKIPAGESVNDAVKRLAQYGEVASVQPNFIYKTSVIPPTDTYYGDLWGLRNTAQTVATGTYGPDVVSTANNPGTNAKDMNLQTAWATITDCSAIVVAVVDTGIQHAHTDLAANMWVGAGAIINHGWDFVGAGDNNPTDDNGHGTHVAGTIGAVGDNGAGTTGVCWNVKLMAVKVLDSTGSGTSADVAEGVDFAVTQGAHVINMSLGSGGNDALLAASIEDARVANIVVVVAAGNDGANNTSTPVYPCNLNKSNMVCVAALSQSYGRASFTNFSTTYVHVGAPGVNIVSTWPYTFARTTDDFTTAWTTTGSGATGFGPLTISGPFDAMAVPTNWNLTNQYANGADERTYKTFDTTGAYTKLMLEYSVLNNLGVAAGDFLRAYSLGTAADPMGGGGTLIDTYSGRTGSVRYANSYDISTPCLNIATCTIGFQLTSNGTTTDSGALIVSFTLLQLTLGDGYNVISGTSMATPHVAGLAALIIAYQNNASYLATDVVTAIKNGGKSASSLVGFTSTGKSVDAPGSLSYIRVPQGISLTTQ